MANLGRFFGEKNHVRFAINVPFPGIKGGELPENTGYILQGGTWQNPPVGRILHNEGVE
jgi:hypothetical protein